MVLSYEMVARYNKYHQVIFLCSVNWTFQIKNYSETKTNHKWLIKIQMQINKIEQKTLIHCHDLIRSDFSLCEGTAVVASSKIWRTFWNYSSFPQELAYWDVLAQSLSQASLPSVP